MSTPARRRPARDSSSESTLIAESVIRGEQKAQRVAGADRPLAEPRRPWRAGAAVGTQGESLGGGPDRVCRSEHGIVWGLAVAVRRAAGTAPTQMPGP
jgi:hypothetical protein